MQLPIQMPRAFSNLILLLSALLLAACGGSSAPSASQNLNSITLIGENPVILNSNEQYIELGALAVDANDTPLEVNTFTAVFQDSGNDFSITYQATDDQGNRVSITRRVFVGDDVLAPSIVLNDANPLIVPVAASFTDPGAQINDNRDAFDALEITTTSTVDFTSEGEYTVSYSATDTAGNANSVNRDVIVVNPANFVTDSNAFITTWTTDSSGINPDQVEIATENGATYNYSINWGDGEEDLNVTTDIIHTYAQAGTYRVAISGDYPIISLSPNANKLVAVNQWGDTQWLSMNATFRGAINLISMTADAPDLSLVTDMASMFEGAAAFNQDIGAWNVSAVTDMVSMFEEAAAFNQDIGAWNVSAVTVMDHMFDGAAAFNQDIGAWNVSVVRGMVSLFEGAAAFNQDISAWNVSVVTDMGRMFFSANDFNQDIGAWDVSAVSDMNNMFSGARNFNQDIGAWDVSAVTRMNNMFNSTALSTVNYDAFLIGLSGQTLQLNVSLGGGGEFSVAAQAARQFIIDNFAWIIADGGLVDTQ